MIKENIDLSIIIPVYNVEKYLPHCLDSIFNQSLDNSDFEVIVVNDCSKGNCEEIIEEYKKKHNNIRLINHEYNKGLYQARRTGIFNSNGKYIMHVDGDDYLSLKEDNKDFLKNAINKLDSSNADILFFDCIHTDGEKEWKEQWFNPPNKNLKNNDEIIKYFYGNGCHTMWGKIYKKSVIDLAYKELKNIEHINLWEDLYQNLVISYFSNYSITINEEFYCYRYLQDSDSRRLRKTKEDKESIIYQIVSILKLINDFMEAKLLYKNYGYLSLDLLNVMCYRAFCLYNELEYSVNSYTIYIYNKIDWIYKVVPSDMIKNIYIESVKNFINNKDILIEKSKSYLFSIIIFDKYIIIRICGIEIKLKNKSYQYKPIVITLNNLLRNIFSIKIDDKYFVLKILFIKLSFRLKLKN